LANSTGEVGEFKILYRQAHNIILLSRRFAGKTMAKPKIPLIVLSMRASDAHVVKAPPIIELGTENDYACGSCGTVLLRANSGQVHNVLLQCSRCSALNKADL